MRPLTLKLILVATCFHGRLANADQLSVSNTFTIDTRFQNIGQSASFTLETRPWDGLSDGSNSGLFTLDARSSVAPGLAVLGPTSVIGGAQASYSIQNAGVDVGIQSTLGFNHAPVAFAGIGGHTLFTYPVTNSQVVQLVATYRGPGGQIQSMPYAVTILPRAALSARATVEATFQEATFYSVALVGTASGGTAPYIFNWDTDNDGQFDDRDGVTSSYLLNSLGGTYPIKLEVSDASGAKAYATTHFTVDKQPVTNEPISTLPTPDPVPPGFYALDGATPFSFDAGKRKNGLLVITHGLGGSAHDMWLSTMAMAIDGKLGSRAPNILIFDWHQDADVTLDQESRNMLSNIVSEITMEDGALAGITARVWMQAALVSVPVLETILLRFSNGPKAGRRLADWIKTNTQAVGETGANIDPNKPIQLIGHSAGGFCVGECAAALKDQGVLVDMVTMLDTPTISEWHIMSQYAPGFVERYNSSIIGALQAPAILRWRVPTFWRYHVSLNFISALDFGVFFWGEFGHSWSHDWYSNTVNDGTKDGFYHSPFVFTGNSIVKSGDNSLSARKSESWSLVSDSDSPLPDQSLSGFIPFGDITTNEKGFTLTEQANAGITQTLTIPVGAEELKFQYQFLTPGDGDFLEVRLSGYPALYVGEDLPLARSGFVEGRIPFIPFNGQAHTLTFKLVSRGSANAMLSIENIRFTMTDDPDGDGLTTAQEFVIGSLPLNDDSDEDGLSDFSEIYTHFTNPMLADTDSDGIADSGELTSGTSPTNGQSFLRVTDMTKNSGGTFTLRWPSQTGRLYNVHRSTDVTFATFDVIGQDLTATPSQNTFLDNSAGTAPAGRYFYRIEVYKP